MNKDSLILLEDIDTNCNACIHFKRDVEWAKKARIEYGVNRLSHAQGLCSKKNITVKTPNGTCTPNNDECWESRRGTNRHYQTILKTE